MAELDAIVSMQERRMVEAVRAGERAETAAEARACEERLR